MAVGVGRALVLSPILVLLFVWAHLAAKDSPNFLWLMYSSFVFLGLATLLLLFSDVERASKRLRRIFYAFVAITILATLGIAFSIASVPPGGTRHYFYFPPETAEITLEYFWTSSGKPGYRGSSSQKILEANYPIGEAMVFYELHEVHVYTDKNVYSNVTVWFSLGFWPNLKYYRSIYELEEGSAIHNGTESVIRFRDDTFTIFWGHTDPGWRDRLDRGYAVDLNIRIELEGPDYGDLKATIPLYPGVHIDDMQVSSQLQDGIAILLCGIFAGALSYIPAKPIKPKIINRFAPALDRINRLLGVQGTPKGFLKKCIECGREIPIASEECPYCKTKQPRKGGPL